MKPLKTSFLIQTYDKNHKYKFEFIQKSNEQHSKSPNLQLQLTSALCSIKYRFVCNVQKRVLNEKYQIFS